MAPFLTSSRLAVKAAGAISDDIEPLSSHTQPRSQRSWELSITVQRAHVEPLSGRPPRFFVAGAGWTDVRAPRAKTQRHGEQKTNARRHERHSVSATPRLCASDNVRRGRRYFFLALALVLLAVFGLAAALVVLPDPHPHRLHAMSAPFQKDPCVTRTIYLHFIGCTPQGTLVRTPPPVHALLKHKGC